MNLDLAFRRLVCRFFGHVWLYSYYQTKPPRVAVRECHRCGRIEGPWE